MLTKIGNILKKSDTHLQQTRLVLIILINNKLTVN